MQISPFNHQFKVLSYTNVTLKHENDTLKFIYTFRVDGKDEKTAPHLFYPQLTLHSVSKEQVAQIGAKRLQHYAFLLGMCELPSYWKAVLTPAIRIQCGALTSKQVAFWDKLLLHGLGEFFYVNQMAPFSPEWSIDSPSFHPITREQPLPETNHVLVPVGGGKDSIVTLELLAQAGVRISTISGNRGASSQVIETFSRNHSLETNLVFERTIDPFLLELNGSGYPNGHTPFSSILAFLTTLIADLNSIPYVALSNERSASEPTGVWQGMNVNHQYSKSFEFEQDVRTYLADSFTSVPQYFSFLRPIYELQIMKLFTSYPQYFPVFKSCNVGQKRNVWCGNCAKCTFVAILLSAFLDDDQVHIIFGREILEDTTLISYVDALIGSSAYKPFECIGTIEESKSALYLSLRRRQGKKTPAVLTHYADWISTQESSLKQESERILKEKSPQHCIPKHFNAILESEI